MPAARAARTSVPRARSSSASSGVARGADAGPEVGGAEEEAGDAGRRARARARRGRRGPSRPSGRAGSRRGARRPGDRRRVLALRQDDARPVGCARRPRGPPRATASPARSRGGGPRSRRSPARARAARPGARLVLRLREDAVLEVHDERVGPARAGLAQHRLGRGGHVEEGAPESGRPSANRNAALARGSTRLRPWNAMPDGARLEKGPGGLDRLALHAAEGEALVYLQGAHVAHFQPKGERPVLWMSAESRFEAGKPIRGGVPICFPWFGPKAGSPDAPLHGFARILPWAVGPVDARGGRQPARGPRAHRRGGGAGRLSRASSRCRWPSPSAARCGWSSRSRNVDRAPVTFEEALHSYFAVSDVRQVRVRGLEGVRLRRQDRGDGAASPARASRSRSRPRPTASTSGRRARSRSRTRAGGGASSSASRARPRRSSGTPGSPRRRRCPTSATRSGRAWSASRRRTPWTTR